MRLSKSQKQLILLGGLMAVIVVVLGIYFFSPQAFNEEPYKPKTVDTDIPKDVVEHPEYRRLRLPVELPLTVGRMGRDNPFEPY
ncbi:MAG TPA: hypothetical protein VL283_05860 [Candidatus Baltobacteraceae bacterium]|nr:hypothetical protein [Candidatus Baltobacteraceae bacterium]